MDTEQHTDKKKTMGDWVIREEIKKFLEYNKNEHTTYKNLWGTAKAVLRGKLSYKCLHSKKRPLN
jgi:hypothetical protein